MSFKVAASDFDGTLYRDQKISDEDLSAIKNWRAAGNKFGIVTGRAFTMLESQLKSFGLEVDFYVCCNGAAIYDSNAQIIFEGELTKDILTEIMKDPFASKSYHFAFETAQETFAVICSEKSWILRENKNWNFTVKYIDADQLDAIPQKINQLALGFDSADESQLASDALNQKFGDKIFAQKNTHSLDIVPAGINKARGVEKLLQLQDWHDAKIFVVGDESNDLPMIKEFGGFTVVTAKDFVKREASQIFDSVGAMLNNFVND